MKERERKIQKLREKGTENEQLVKKPGEVEDFSYESYEEKQKKLREAIDEGIKKVHENNKKYENGEVN